jgi:hypothetical protein
MPQFMTCKGRKVAEPVPTLAVGYRLLVIAYPRSVPNLSIICLASFGPMPLSSCLK